MMTQEEMDWFADRFDALEKQIDMASSPGVRDVLDILAGNASGSLIFDAAGKAYYLSPYSEPGSPEVIVKPGSILFKLLREQKQ